MKTPDTLPQWFTGGLVRRYRHVAYRYMAAGWNAVGSGDDPAELRRRFPGAVVLPCGQLPTSEHLAEQAREQGQ